MRLFLSAHNLLGCISDPAIAFMAKLGPLQSIMGNPSLLAGYNTSIDCEGITEAKVLAMGTAYIL